MAIIYMSLETKELFGNGLCLRYLETKELFAKNRHSSLETKE
jgi:hypothetical protein